MSLDHGWSNIPRPFIAKLIEILSNPTNLVNVSRPATSILKRLVEADPRFAPQANAPGSSKAGGASAPGKSPVAVTGKSPLQTINNAKAPQGGIWTYGFDVVFDEMRSQGSGGKRPQDDADAPIKVLETVVKRLSSGDSMMAMDRLAAFSYDLWF